MQLPAQNLGKLVISFESTFHDPAQLGTFLLTRLGKDMQNLAPNHLPTPAPCSYTNLTVYGQGRLPNLLKSIKDAYPNNAKIRGCWDAFFEDEWETLDDKPLKSSPVKIEPRGLESFDKDDSKFYPALLPG